MSISSEDSMDLNDIRLSDIQTLNSKESSNISKSKFSNKKIQNSLHKLNQSLDKDMIRSSKNVQAKLNRNMETPMSENSNQKKKKKKLLNSSLFSSQVNIFDDEDNTSPEDLEKTRNSIRQLIVEVKGKESKEKKQKAMENFTYPKTTFVQTLDNSKGIESSNQTPIRNLITRNSMRSKSLSPPSSMYRRKRGNIGSYNRTTVVSSTTNDPFSSDDSEDLIWYPRSVNHHFTNISNEIDIFMGNILNSSDISDILLHLQELNQSNHLSDIQLWYVEGQDDIYQPFHRYYYNLKSTEHSSTLPIKLIQSLFEMDSNKVRKDQNNRNNITMGRKNVVETISLSSSTHHISWIELIQRLKSSSISSHHKIDSCIEVSLHRLDRQSKLNENVKLKSKEISSLLLIQIPKLSSTRSHKHRPMAIYGSLSTMKESYLHRCYHQILYAISTQLNRIEIESIQSDDVKCIETLRKEIEWIRITQESSSSLINESIKEFNTCRSLNEVYATLIETAEELYQYPYFTLRLPIHTNMNENLFYESIISTTHGIHTVRFDSNPTWTTIHQQYLKYTDNQDKKQKEMDEYEFQLVVETQDMLAIHPKFSQYIRSHKMFTDLVSDKMILECYILLSNRIRSNNIFSDYHQDYDSHDDYHHTILLSIRPYHENNRKISSLSYDHIYPIRSLLQIALNSIQTIVYNTIQSKQTLAYEKLYKIYTFNRLRIFFRSWNRIAYLSKQKLIEKNKKNMYRIIYRLLDINRNSFKKFNRIEFMNLLESELKICYSHVDCDVIVEDVLQSDSSHHYNTYNHDILSVEEYRKDDPNSFQSEYNYSYSYSKAILSNIHIITGTIALYDGLDRKESMKVATIRIHLLESKAISFFRIHDMEMLCDICNLSSTIYSCFIRESTIHRNDSENSYHLLYSCLSKVLPILSYAMDSINDSILQNISEPRIKSTTESEISTIDRRIDVENFMIQNRKSFESIISMLCNKIKEITKSDMVMIKTMIPMDGINVDVVDDNDEGEDETRSSLRIDQKVTFISGRSDDVPDKKKIIENSIDKNIYEYEYEKDSSDHQISYHILSHSMSNMVSTSTVAAELTLLSSNLSSPLSEYSSHTHRQSMKILSYLIKLIIQSYEISYQNLYSTQIFQSNLSNTIQRLQSELSDIEIKLLNAISSDHIVQKELNLSNDKKNELEKEWKMANERIDYLENEIESIKYDYKQDKKQTILSYETKLTNIESERMEYMKINSDLSSRIEQKDSYCMSIIELIKQYSVDYRTKQSETIYDWLREYSYGLGIDRMESVEQTYLGELITASSLDGFDSMLANLRLTSHCLESIRSGIPHEVFIPYSSMLFHTTQSYGHLKDSIQKSMLAYRAKALTYPNGGIYVYIIPNRNHSLPIPTPILSQSSILFHDKNKKQNVTGNDGVFNKTYACMICIKEMMEGIQNNSIPSHVVSSLISSTKTNLDEEQKILLQLAVYLTYSTLSTLSTLQHLHLHQVHPTITIKEDSKNRFDDLKVSQPNPMNMNDEENEENMNLNSTINEKNKICELYHRIKNCIHTYSSLWQIYHKDHKIKNNIKDFIQKSYSSVLSYSMEQNISNSYEYITNLFVLDRFPLEKSEKQTIAQSSTTGVNDDITMAQSLLSQGLSFGDIPMVEIVIRTKKAYRRGNLICTPIYTTHGDIYAIVIIEKRFRPITSYGFSGDGDGNDNDNDYYGGNRVAENNKRSQQKSKLSDLMYTKEDEEIIGIFSLFLYPIIDRMNMITDSTKNIQVAMESVEDRKKSENRVREEMECCVMREEEYRGTLKEGFLLLQSLLSTKTDTLKVIEFIRSAFISTTKSDHCYIILSNMPEIYPNLSDSSYFTIESNQVTPIPVTLSSDDMESLAILSNQSILFPSNHGNTQNNVIPQNSIIQNSINRLHQSVIESIITYSPIHSLKSWVIRRLQEIGKLVSFPFLSNQSMLSYDTTASNVLCIPIHLSNNIKGSVVLTRHGMDKSYTLIDRECIDWLINLLRFSIAFKRNDRYDVSLETQLDKLQQQIHNYHGINQKIGIDLESFIQKITYLSFNVEMIPKQTTIQKNETMLMINNHNNHDNSNSYNDDRTSKISTSMIDWLKNMIMTSCTLLLESNDIKVWLEDRNESYGIAKYNNKANIQIRSDCSLWYWMSSYLIPSSASSNTNVYSSNRDNIEDEYDKELYVQNMNSHDGHDSHHNSNNSDKNKEKDNDVVKNNRRLNIYIQLPSLPSIKITVLLHSSSIVQTDTVLSMDILYKLKLTMLLKFIDIQIQSYHIYHNYEENRVEDKNRLESNRLSYEKEIEQANQRIRNILTEKEIEFESLREKYKIAMNEKAYDINQCLELNRIVSHWLCQIPILSKSILSYSKRLDSILPKTILGMNNHLLQSIQFLHHFMNNIQGIGQKSFTMEFGLVNSIDSIINRNVKQNMNLGIKWITGSDITQEVLSLFCTHSNMMESNPMISIDSNYDRILRYDDRYHPYRQAYDSNKSIICIGNGILLDVAKKAVDIFSISNRQSNRNEDDEKRYDSIEILDVTNLSTDFLTSKSEKENDKDFSYSSDMENRIGVMVKVMEIPYTKTKLLVVLKPIPKSIVNQITVNNLSKNLMISMLYSIKYIEIGINNLSKQSYVSSMNTYETNQLKISNLYNTILLKKSKQIILFQSFHIWKVYVESIHSQKQSKLVAQQTEYMTRMLLMKLERRSADWIELAKGLNGAGILGLSNGIKGLWTHACRTLIAMISGRIRVIGLGLIVYQKSSGLENKSIGISRYENSQLNQDSEAIEFVIKDFSTPKKHDIENPKEAYANIGDIDIRYAIELGDNVYNLVNSVLSNTIPKHQKIYIIEQKSLSQSSLSHNRVGLESPVSKEEVWLVPIRTAKSILGLLRITVDPIQSSNSNHIYRTGSYDLYDDANDDLNNSIENSPMNRNSTEQNIDQNIVIDTPLSPTTPYVDIEETKSCIINYTILFAPLLSAAKRIDSYKLTLSEQMNSLEEIYMQRQDAEKELEVVIKSTNMLSLSVKAIGSVTSIDPIRSETTKNNKNHSNHDNSENKNTAYSIAKKLSETLSFVLGVSLEVKIDSNVIKETLSPHSSPSNSKSSTSNDLSLDSLKSSSLLSHDMTIEDLGQNKREEISSNKKSNMNIIKNDKHTIDSNITDLDNNNNDNENTKNSIFQILYNASNEAIGKIIIKFDENDIHTQTNTYLNSPLSPHIHLISNDNKNMFSKYNYASNLSMDSPMDSPMNLSIENKKYYDTTYDSPYPNANDNRIDNPISLKENNNKLDVSYISYKQIWQTILKPLAKIVSGVLCSYIRELEAKSKVTIAVNSLCKLERMLVENQSIISDYQIQSNELLSIISTKEKYMNIYKNIVGFTMDLISKKSDLTAEHHVESMEESLQKILQPISNIMSDLFYPIINESIVCNVALLVNSIDMDKGTDTNVESVVNFDNYHDMDINMNVGSNIDSNTIPFVTSKNKLVWYSNNNNSSGENNTDLHLSMSIREVCDNIAIACLKNNTPNIIEIDDDDGNIVTAKRSSKKLRIITYPITYPLHGPIGSVVESTISSPLISPVDSLEESPTNSHSIDKDQDDNDNSSNPNNNSNPNKNNINTAIATVDNSSNTMNSVGVIQIIYPISNHTTYGSNTGKKNISQNMMAKDKTEDILIICKDISFAITNIISISILNQNKNNEIMLLEENIVGLKENINRLKGDIIGLEDDILAMDTNKQIIVESNHSYRRTADLWRNISFAIITIINAYSTIDMHEDRREERNSNNPDSNNKNDVNRVRKDVTYSNENLMGIIESDSVHRALKECNLSIDISIQSAETSKNNNSDMEVHLDSNTNINRINKDHMKILIPKDIQSDFKIIIESMSLDTNSTTISALDTFGMNDIDKYNRREAMESIGGIIKGLALIGMKNNEKQISDRHNILSLSDKVLSLSNKYHKTKSDYKLLKESNENLLLSYKTLLQSNTKLLQTKETLLQSNTKLSESNTKLMESNENMNKNMNDQIYEQLKEWKEKYITLKESLVRVRKLYRVVSRESSILLDPPLSSLASDSLLSDKVLLFNRNNDNINNINHTGLTHPAILPTAIALQDTCLKVLTVLRTLLRSEGQAILLQDTCTDPISFQAIYIGTGIRWPGIAQGSFGIAIDTIHEHDHDHDLDNKLLKLPKESITAYVMRNHKPIVLNLGIDDSRVSYNPNIDGFVENNTPMLYLPIRGQGGGVVGVITIVKGKNGSHFTSEDIVIAELVASLGSISLYWCEGIARLGRQEKGENKDHPSSEMMMARQSSRHSLMNVDLWKPDSSVENHIYRELDDDQEQE